MTLQGFWKGWHSSFNLWLVRYLYLPLGGARWRALSVWPIFTFVALWWGSMMMLMLAPCDDEHLHRLLYSFGAALQA